MVLWLAHRFGEAKKDGLERVIGGMFGCLRSCPGYPVMNYLATIRGTETCQRASGCDVSRDEHAASHLDTQTRSPSFFDEETRREGDPSLRGYRLTFSMFIHPPNPAPRSKTGVSLGSSDLTILSPDTFRKEVVGAILALCVVL